MHANREHYTRYFLVTRLKRALHIKMHKKKKDKLDS